MPPGGRELREKLADVGRDAVSVASIFAGGQQREHWAWTLATAAAFLADPRWRASASERVAPCEPKIPRAADWAHGGGRNVTDASELPDVLA